MARGKFFLCESSLLYLLRYRNNKYMKANYVHGQHAWTERQSNLIDAYGWKYWLTKTHGPKGVEFDHVQKKT